MIRKFVFSILFLFLSLVGLQGQMYTSQNGRAIKNYVEGTTYFQQEKYDLAKESLQKAISHDSIFIEAYLYLAGVYLRTDMREQAVECYKKGLAINATFYPSAFVDLANNEILLHRYEDALRHFEFFIKSGKGTERLRKQAADKLSTCKFGAEAVKKPVPFKPINLGDSINSIYNDYWPTITGDMNTLLLTRLLPKSQFNEVVYSYQEDFYIAHKKGEKWRKAKNAGLPLNTTDNEGAPTLQTDGRSIIFTACNRPTGNGECDLYMSRYVDGRWELPVNLGPPVNTASSEKQPSLSPDGRYLYFASNRTGGKGMLDLYVSELLSNNKWSKPIPLTELNTTGNDMSPFIHADNQTLFFSSDGHIGMGGQDIFMTKRDTGGKWSTPINLGYPINTAFTEDGMIIDISGKNAYYAAKHNDSRGGMDLYTFVLPSFVRPSPTAYMKGNIYNAKTKDPLQANFELLRNSNGKLFMKSQSDKKSGGFFMTIPSGENYALNVSLPGYLFFSENFFISDTNCFDKPFNIDIPLQPIEVGAIIVLKNIFFATDSFALKPESSAELKKIAEFMLQNPALIIEIRGHTDNTGNELYNIELSTKRAYSVVDRLVSLGIDRSRFKAQGFGMNIPLMANDTPEGRAMNRRTEMKIIQ